MASAYSSPLLPERGSLGCVGAPRPPGHVSLVVFWVACLLVLKMFRGSCVSSLLQLDLMRFAGLRSCLFGECRVMLAAGQWHLIILPCLGHEGHLLPLCVEVAAFRVGCSASAEGTAALGSHLRAAVGASSEDRDSSIYKSQQKN